MKTKINDYGRKIPYARKDFYLPKKGEYHINVCKIWPKVKVRSQDQFCRYLINVLRKDIENLQTTNKETADKYIEMVTTIRDKLIDIEESDEFFNVVRKIEYGHDYYGDSLFDTQLLFGDHGISYSKMNQLTMYESHFEETPEDIAKEKVQSSIWLVRYDFETYFNEEENQIEIKIPDDEIDRVIITIPTGIIFSEQKWNGYFITVWDDDRQERVVSQINASQGDYDLKAAELYKKELAKIKPSRKQASRIQITESCPGKYEGPDYLRCAFPDEKTCLRVFGLATQFGNSFTQSNRREIMPKIYRSLANLATTLKCSPIDLSLPIGEMNLGIAFGARGHGGLRASRAHYEPSQHVINITRSGALSGGGSLGHEFMHALDHWLFCQLIENNDTTLLTDLSVEELATVLPEMTEIVQFLSDPSTRFYQDALSLDSLDGRNPKKPYWSSLRETFARGGASSLIKLLHNNHNQWIRDDFLSWNFMKEVKYGSRTVSACPTGRELEYLAELYKNLFAAIIRIGLWQPLKEEDLYLYQRFSTGQSRSDENKPLVFLGNQVSFL